MSDLLRRFRFPLTYLLLSAMCGLGMASARGASGELGLATRLVMGLTVPLERMVTFPVGVVRGALRDYLWLVGLREENRRLREQIGRLEEENLQYSEAIVASERFERLAGFRAAHEAPMLPADVIAHDLSLWFRSIVLDRGADDGIRPGMPVITDLGVVGVVAGTTGRASKVVLVTDPQSRIDAFVQRTRARGTVGGRARQLCEFEYVPRDTDVRAGDRLLTSGRGAIYPKGLVLGRVSEVERRPFGLFRRARVRPAVDFGTLEEVFVILERRELPAPDAFTGDPWPEAEEEPG